METHVVIQGVLYSCQWMLAGYAMHTRSSELGHRIRRAKMSFGLSRGDARVRLVEGWDPERCLMKIMLSLLFFKAMKPS